MTNGRPQTRYSANLSWSPWPIVQLRGSIDYAEAAPSFDHLDGPIVTTVGRLFDYARQEIAEPVWIPGGKDRKSVVEGKSVSVPVDLGGRRILKKNNNHHN